MQLARARRERLMWAPSIIRLPRFFGKKEGGRGGEGGREGLRESENDI